MAIGKASDFVIYEDEFMGGAVETVAQFIDAFGTQSKGAIKIETKASKGQYNSESFIKDISGLIIRRDLTAVTAATDLAMTQGEFIGVKCARTIGPVAQTFDAWRKVLGTLGGGSGEALQREMSFKLGQIITKKQLQDYLHTALIAVTTAIEGQAALNYTTDAANKMTHSILGKGLAKMGDQASRVVAWIMHSTVAFDLLEKTIAASSALESVTGLAIIEGQIQTLGRPAIVTDDAALIELVGSASTIEHSTLGLVEGAVTVVETELLELVTETVTGLLNLVHRIQGEYSFNVEVKGMKWDIANGGANPTDAAIGTTTNWDKAATADKDLAGCRIETGLT